MNPLNITKIDITRNPLPSPWVLLYEDRIKCGFPSPAEGYAEKEIDFNNYIIDHPYSSYCFHVKGDSMEGLHIAEGDLIVVDRSIPLESGRIIICCLDREFTLKQFVKRGNKAQLLPANPNYKAITLTENSEFEYWGTAVSLVRKF
jgi:DNA polymerase V